MEYNIADLEHNLSHELTKKRFWHTIGVRYTAAAMAMKYSSDIRKAEIAGLLHDCAKCLSNEEILEACFNFNVKINEIEKRNPYLLHAKLGAVFANKKYHITDKEILHAITYHTTGRPNMNLLEKIIFIADYIEPNRKPIDGLDKIRKIAFEDIDKTVLMILEHTLQYLRLQKEEREIDTMTIEAYQYYRNLKLV